MSKSSNDLRRRFPKLSKLAIAILEHLVEATLGEAAIEEVKKPYAEKQIADSLAEALAKVESEFIEQNKGQPASDLLLQLPVHDLPDMPESLWSFYKRPNDRSFSRLLTVKLKQAGKLTKPEVDLAVNGYLNLLKRELTSVDRELREKIQALAILDLNEIMSATRDAVIDIRDYLRGKAVVGIPLQPTIAKQIVQPGSLPEGSYLPFTRNALFTGRDADLHKLESSLLGAQPSSALISQTITGMGGIGKTQLAVEFAFLYGNKFIGIHWLDLRDLAALDSQIAHCGSQMLLKPWSNELPEQVIITLAAWKAAGPRLVILDNFEEPHEGPQILSRIQHPSLRLLITSRRSDWPAALGLQSYSLDLMTEGESLDFLRKYTENRYSEQQLKLLAERLGRLPLALELAGRYLAQHKRLTIEQYIANIEKALAHESMRGFRSDLPNPTRHDLDLFATFSLSFGQIEAEPTRRLIMLAGYCAPNIPIPPEIFEASLEMDETACDASVVALLGLGLLQENTTIHPLLAEFARFLDRDNLVLSLLAQKLAGIANERNAQVDRTGNYSLYAPLLLHVRSVAGNAESAHLQSAGSLWNSLGYHIHDLADYAGARAAYERALKIDEAAFGPDHPEVATDVNNLGSVMKALGDLAGARAAYERALKIDEAAFGPYHPKVAIRVNNLGGVLQALGDLAGARAAIERALKIDEAAFGPDHPNVAIRVNNLGSVLQDLGDLAGARAAYERALKIDEAAFGPDHPGVATDFNNLGSVMKALGDLAGARAACERALKIDEAAFGPDHPEVAICVNNLGGVLQALGDLAGARAAYERALEIDEAAFGPDHPEVAICVNNLGGVLQDLGDLAGARAAYERALRILKQFLPAGHSNIRVVEANLRSLSQPGS